MNKLLTLIICTSLGFQSYANDTGNKFGDLLQQVKAAHGSDEVKGNLNSDIITAELAPIKEPSPGVSDQVLKAQIQAALEQVAAEEAAAEQAARENHVAEIEVIIDDEPKVEVVEEVVRPVKEGVVSEIVDDGKLSYLRYNELRDVSRHDKNVAGTSKRILKALAADTLYFTQTEGVRFYLRRDKEEVSAIGPVTSGRKTVTIDGESKSAARIVDSRAERRKNVIISVSYERIVDVTKEDKVFNADLLLFIHSDAKGYFFKTINIDIDWTQKANEEGDPTITLKSTSNEISLSDTDFEIRSELGTQRTILRDKNYGITRVFPTTAGAIAAREKIDGQTSSMTLLLPGKSGEFKDFKFNESVLVKQTIWKSTWINGQNSSERIYPAYYKGRPFIGIVDRSRVSGLILDERDNYVLADVAVSPDYGEGYRQIAYHYQISDKRRKDGSLESLQRTFDSHGCMRLQDHDLYMLFDVLNAGPKDMIPVEVKMDLGNVYADIDSIDSVYTKNKGFKKVVYGTRPNSPENIYCKSGSKYEVRKFGRYHTISDGDCLSQTAPEQNETLADLTAFLTGETTTPPRTIDWGGIEHKPIIVREAFFAENKQFLAHVDGNVADKDPELYLSTLSQLEQIKREKLIDAFKLKNPDFKPVAAKAIQPVPQIRIESTGKGKWPKLTGSRDSRVGRYNRKCQNRRIGKETIRKSKRAARNAFCTQQYNALTGN